MPDGQNNVDDTKAFSGKVDTVFRPKMRQRKNAKAFLSPVDVKPL
jgi:hypothetical protein